MTDLIEAAKVRAALIIAKAEKETAVLAALPANLPSVPMVVLQKDFPWLSFKVQTLAEILTIYDAFPRVLALDCKGTYRRITPDGMFDAEEHGAILSDYTGWIEIDARCPSYLSGAQRATIRFYGSLTDEQTVQVSIDLDIGHWNKAGFPMLFYVPFRNASLSGRRAEEWTYDRPEVAAHSDDYCAFGTGADRPGMAHHGRAFFSDIRGFLSSLIPAETKE